MTKFPYARKAPADRPTTARRGFLCLPTGPFTFSCGLTASFGSAVYAGTDTTALRQRSHIQRPSDSLPSPGIRKLFFHSHFPHCGNLDVPRAEPLGKPLPLGCFCPVQLPENTAAPGPCPPPDVRRISAHFSPAHIRYARARHEPQDRPPPVAPPGPLPAVPWPARASSWPCCPAHPSAPRFLPSCTHAHTA